MAGQTSYGLSRHLSVPYDEAADRERRVSTCQTDTMRFAESIASLIH